MREWITAILMLLGAAFMLLAAVGITRMPDTFTRMQPGTKASTLGVGCMMLAVAVHFGTVGVTTRALAGITFVVLTAPVAAHMIGRAAYIMGAPVWEGTKLDELKGHYDPKTHELSSELHELPTEELSAPVEQTPQPEQTDEPRLLQQ
jgi:multicomponent Na+:H+ antiporter subunit G